MIDKSEAVNIILSRVESLSAEKVTILNSPGRVISKEIFSPINIPPNDNSAMDGYAIISDDVKNASLEEPVSLEVSDEIKAGGDFESIVLVQNHAVRIMTGGPIPRGADAVIQFEDTAEENNIVKVYRSVAVGENIRKAGEDIKSGSLVLDKGDRLKSSDIGLLASINISEVEVFRRPEAAILSSGDEVVEVGEKIGPGQIRNSNYYTLYSEIKKYNALPRYIGIAGDTLEKTKLMLSDAMRSDVIITTGGVSMGKYDFIKDAVRELGFEILFDKVRMKPGKPCVFGIKGKKLFFGLPGNPVSTMVSFLQFVRPALLKLMGASNIEKPLVKAVLEEDLTKKSDREHYLRGYFTVRSGDFYVSSTGDQGSGILRSMSIANCLIIIPQGISKVKKGDRVFIQLIHHEEV